MASSVDAFWANRRVWITGASSGIGEALAYALCSRGAQLVLSARRQAELERVCNACVALPRERTVLIHRPAVLVLDLEDIDRLPHAAADAERLLGGHVQVLVNNGGLSVRAAVLDTVRSVEDKVMKVNFTAPTVLTHAVLPAMVQAGEGRIVVVSSVQGRVALPDRAAYSASKHALHGYFNALRCEVADQGVKVTLALPGYVATSLSLNALRADGTLYNRMDESTRRGFRPSTVADRLVRGVAKGQREVWVMQLEGRLAIYASFLVPALLDRVLSARRSRPSPAT